MFVISKVYCRRYKRNKSDERLSMYKESKTSLFQLIKDTKATFYNNSLTNLSKSNQIWSELRNFGLVDTSTCIEPSLSSDLLNAYFSSVQCSDDNVSAPPIFYPSFPYNFSFSEITLSDLEWSFRQFKSKSVGVDNISLRVLELCLPILGPVFVNLFNKSLMSQAFPSNWKKALILPINKSINPTVPEHYRSISILCVISKIFEKIIARDIMNFLTTHGILD